MDSLKELQNALKERPPIPEDLVTNWAKRLTGRKLEALMTLRGLTRETLERYQVGWDGERYTLPIRDRAGELVNVRRYSPSGSGGKLLNFTLPDPVSPKVRHSYGSPARLYGVDTLPGPGELVVLTEGELDRLALEEHGFRAVSGTHGAGTFPPDFAEALTGLDVVVLYDCDAPGKKHARETVAVALQGVQLSRLRVVDLPLAGTKEEKDASDWFKQGRTAQELRELIDRTPDYQHPEPKPPLQLELVPPPGGPLLTATGEDLQAVRDRLREEAKQQVGVSGILERHGVECKREGSTFRARCPFHEDSKPSLWWKDGDTAARCDPCGKSFDVLALEERLARVDFPQADRTLFALAGIEYPEPSRKTRIPTARPKTSKKPADRGARTDPSAVSGALIEAKKLTPRGRVELDRLLARYVYRADSGAVVDLKGDRAGMPPRRFKEQYPTLGRLWEKSENEADPALRRTVVPASRVVFEPDSFDPDSRMAHRDPGKLNLYTGLPGRPDPEAGCRAILQVFEHLLAVAAQESAEVPQAGETHNRGMTVRDWVVCWLAKKVQEPGYFPRSALVIRGAQGVGKGLIFDNVVRAIFGSAYSVAKTKSDMEAVAKRGWNDWLTNRLYVLCDEVEMPPEMEGTLKRWIGSDTVSIERRGVDSKELPTYAAWVFLANYTTGIPVRIPTDDRRFCVFDTPDPLPLAVYDAAFRELKAGGAAGFHAWLEAVEIPESFASDRVPRTEAKQRLIAASADPVAAFFLDWQAGDILTLTDEVLPYGPVLAADLWEAFSWYRSRNGGKRVTKGAFEDRIRHLIGCPKMRRKRDRKAWWGNPSGWEHPADTLQALAVAKYAHAETFADRLKLLSRHYSEPND